MAGSSGRGSGHVNQMLIVASGTPHDRYTEVGLG